MNKADIIIVGAGAAGLIAAKELSGAGKNVIVLEADLRIGGRIHTLHEPGFQMPIEGGAEFIHGHLPVTLGLLKEYGIHYHPVEGEMWNVRLTEDKGNDSHWDFEPELIEKLKGLKVDISVTEFIDSYFTGEKYTSLAAFVKGFVSGYDTADPDQASSFAFRDEWLQADVWEQYRVEGGYGKLVQALAKNAEKNGCTIHLSSEVREIIWEKDEVNLITEDQKNYSAGKVFISVPLGILKAGAISFSPPIKDKLTAVSNLGFGRVIKIILQFNSPFWKEEKYRVSTVNELGFIFSDASIPTWWTQAPSESAILIGWIGGRASEKYDHRDTELLQECLNSLAAIFKTSEDDMREKLASWKIFNWNVQPHVMGSYSFLTVDAFKAISELAQPVENTLFFGGEALYTGKETGTVGAALASGLAAVKQIL